MTPADSLHLHAPHTIHPVGTRPARSWFCRSNPIADVSFLNCGSVDEMNQLAFELGSTALADSSAYGGSKLCVAKCLWVDSRLNLNPHKSIRLSKHGNNYQITHSSDPKLVNLSMVTARPRKTKLYPSIQSKRPKIRSLNFT